VTICMCDVTQLDVAPVYDLFAVLIHRGQSASSGHYVALIKDPVTGNTYKFNDTKVEKEKKFSLANEEDTGTDSVHSGECLSQQPVVLFLCCRSFTLIVFV